MAATPWILDIEHSGTEQSQLLRLERLSARNCQVYFVGFAAWVFEGGLNSTPYLRVMAVPRAV
jgi:hypothetical protein